jgi:hypothetical protein
MLNDNFAYRDFLAMIPSALVGRQGGRHSLVWENAAMQTRSNHLAFLTLAVAAWAWPALSLAVPCPSGMVARQAAPTDRVCVAPETRRRAAAENAQAALRWQAGGFGPKTCATGFVWRQAFPADLVCVTPDIRAATLSENANPQGDVGP